MDDFLTRVTAAQMNAVGNHNSAHGEQPTTPGALEQIQVRLTAVLARLHSIEDDAEDRLGRMTAVNPSGKTGSPCPSGILDLLNSIDEATSSIAGIVTRF